jgi:hypothetical protein
MVNLAFCRWECRPCSVALQIGAAVGLDLLVCAWCVWYQLFEKVGVHGGSGSEMAPHLSLRILSENYFTDARTASYLVGFARLPLR